MSARILAIETATEACSAALMIDNIISERFAVTPCEHTQHILLMVDSLLAEANMTLSDLDTLAFSRGPGSFTGVRISISIAQGLALGANLSLIGISTLATLAQGTWRQTGANQVLTAIDARMGEVYYAQYCRQNKGEWLGETSEAVLRPEELVRHTSKLTGEWFCAGTGWISYPVLIAIRQHNIKKSKDIIRPSAQDILPLAQQQWRKGFAQSVDKVKPSYLRNNVACNNYLKKMR